MKRPQTSAVRKSGGTGTSCSEEPAKWRLRERGARARRRGRGAGERPPAGGRGLQGRRLPRVSRIKHQRPAPTKHTHTPPPHHQPPPPAPAHLASMSPLATPWPTRPQAMPAREYSRNFTPTQANLFGWLGEGGVRSGGGRLAVGGRPRAAGAAARRGPRPAACGAGPRGPPLLPAPPHLRAPPLLLPPPPTPPHLEGIEYLRTPGMEASNAAEGMVASHLASAGGRGEGEGEKESWGSKGEGRSRRGAPKGSPQRRTATAGPPRTASDRRGLPPRASPPPLTSIGLEPSTARGAMSDTRATSSTTPTSRSWGAGVKGDGGQEGGAASAEGRAGAAATGGTPRRAPVPAAAPRAPAAPSAPPPSPPPRAHRQVEFKLGPEVLAALADLGDGRARCGRGRARGGPRGGGPARQRRSAAAGRFGRAPRVRLVNHPPHRGRPPPHPPPHHHHQKHPDTHRNRSRSRRRP
jgi:hypothetical protein